MKEISEHLWVDQRTGFSIVQPKDHTDWIVMNKQSAIMFGPNNLANCKRFVESNYA